MFQVIVWIQNPDKTQSDQMFLNGHLIKSTAFGERADLAKIIFDTESSAIEIFKTIDLSIARFKWNYLIKYQSSTLDENGRSMPVLILIENYIPDLEKDLLSHINSALSKSENFIEEDYLSIILSKLNEKRSTQKKKKNLILISVVSLILIVLFIIIINL